MRQVVGQHEVDCSILGGERGHEMERHADLVLSYADCVGAAVARETGARAVLGLDNDFRILGFTLEP